MVKTFTEKPYLNMKVWTGVACLQPEILNYLSVGADFARDVFPAILQHGGKLYAYCEDVEWLDIGSVMHYRMACEKARAGTLR
jgi:NDP-sugar pyrophosphorylase family protein